MPNDETPNGQATDSKKLRAIDAARDEREDHAQHPGYGVYLVLGPMSVEILTLQLTESQIREELHVALDDLASLGYEHCEVLFGYAWGNDYYPTAHWEYEIVPILGVLAALAQVEDRWPGKLGSNDLFLRLPDSELEFHFCNDSDVHLAFREKSPIVDLTHARWSAMGYINPASSALHGP